ncbi:hypothetical protein BG011_001709 [Mortierella polycephala]|uniref:DUF1308 domain-containing protein n=1 Tax=Mortierella polycephala TaxID=41804 RepID=A0A9P6PL49_9FUNG|nr:hypothetical protein BG011_001709 [Mortierella polycephala]
MDVQEKAQALLKECKDIVKSLDAWRECNPTFDIDSLSKILHAEKKFLEKVVSTPAEEIKPVMIASSNVPYLKSLSWALVHSRNPVAICKTFNYVCDPFTAIVPSEKFKALPINHGQQQGGTKANRTPGKRAAGNNIMQLTTSEPLSTSLSNVQTFQVKVDLVADHGKSWLKINAGSTRNLIFEFADMEDDSDDDQDEDSNEDSEDENAHGKNGSSIGENRRIRNPVHVSMDTHSDMTLMTRSLVLAADQNRVHYSHVPKVTLRFAGILPEENTTVENMIGRAVRIGRVAQSMTDGIAHQFPVDVVFGPIETSTSPAVKSTTSMDPFFQPFSIPQTVDDMVFFTRTLHLDITTLMALSSFLCHTIRPDPELFTSPPLVLQAKQEHDEPLLPLLSKVFEGRDRLVMTRTAATRFNSILSVIGGPEEKWRGKVMVHDPLEESLQDGEGEDEISIRERWVRGSDWAQQYGVFASGPPHIEVIEDILGCQGSTSNSAEEEGQHQQYAMPQPSSSSPTLMTSPPGTPTSSASTLLTDLSLDTGSKSGPGLRRRELNMSELHYKIFLTGYNARLTTITANLMGYRTMTRAGQVPSDVSVWFHPPRSLAEAKLPTKCSTSP